MAAGSPGAAIDLLGAPGEGIGLAGCLERVTLARAHLALDGADQVVGLLDPLLDPALPYAIQAVQARVLLAQAYLARSREPACLAVLAEAVDLARHERVIGPFVTAGESLSPLIARLGDIGGSDRDFTRDLLAAIAATPRG